ncbi:hypothetical protein AVEN_260252-1, partial [Araneus ventricosus]
MELERLKEKRKGLRISFTKHLTKIETTLGKEIAAGYTKEAKLDELLSLKSQLTEKLNELIKTDESVQLKIEISAMAAEIASSEEYKDKGIDLKSKLQRQIELLCDRPQINTSSQSTDNTDTIILSRNETKSVKLPKLNIQTFHGDCSYFLDFWNSFEVAIHKNDSLTKIEKFTYLKTYLGGIALNAVSGFSLTDQNYDASIKLLKERFGRTDIIISSHMHKLLLIDSVKSCFNVTGLRKMYDAIETQIRSLQSLGVATGTYSNLLCPVILQKLPEELNLNYNRQRKTDELFDITNLVEVLRKFEIPRLYFNEVNWESVELHLFSDASPKCYGSVAYFRIKSADRYVTSFIMSKSRLAPLKKLTLPRLELLGALISARMGHYLQDTFPMLKRENIFYWSDSQICIHWIKGKADDWKQFVRNRVSEIKEKTNPNWWHHCAGKFNPADKLTRGISAQALVNDEIWFSGPPWLLQINVPYNKSSDVDDTELICVEEERRKLIVTFQTNIESFQPLLNLDNYSDVNKVIRITSYVLRFANNCRPNREKVIGNLTANDLINAEKYWVRCVQQTEFQTEYEEIEHHKSVTRSSKLFSLNPMMTEDGLLCLGGRLQKSDFNFHEKHPLILPTKSRLSQLLIIREHQRLHHAGVSETLTQIRENYWILCGRQTVKSCLNKCLICKKFKVRPGNQIMAPLPANRIQASYPFENVGIDFAGPIYSKNTDKAYIALFTCAVTRAIHLEVVSSLSTEHFLLAFRRFISRRGICHTVNSDNAMTFKSADIELKRLYMNICEPEVQNYFGKKGIKWQYIVERAGWWGGYWERMVQITKIALRKILGRALVSFEELQTILAEIEAIINSRPLTYVYNEPNEPFPLTPANFLTGRRLTALPNWSGKRNIELFKGKKELIKRYLYREKILKNFWKRWKREYLLQLKGANLNKNVNVKTEFNVNDIVLIGEEKVPRQLWKLGKVIDVHKGRDSK